ncbi:MAG: 30S ribosomal protein S2 [Candidatus Pacearchaeota archaeon]|nr:MAG: 30S ribosomal protein S2 [Candidatus Pacearchaeota archaeon]
MPRKKKEEKIEEKKEKVEDKEKEKKKETKEKEEMLVPLEDYIKAAVHLGTRAVTPGMREYVYRRKADGIAVLNTRKIDEKIALAANFLAQFEPEKTLVCCKRDAGHKALRAFGKATGTKIFEKYPPGMITNPDLENFYEPNVVFVIDPWLDKNIIRDAVKVHIPIVALCDTNNIIDNIDLVVPCNNKAPKSIGLIFYIITKLYLQKKGIKKKLNSNDFYEFGEETEKKKKVKEDKEKIKELIAKKLRMMRRTKEKK